MALTLRGYVKEFREIYFDLFDSLSQRKYSITTESARGGCIRINPGLRVIQLHLTVGLCH